MPPLLWVLDPLPAAKVFLTLSVWLYWLGPALFLLRLGQYRPAALLTGQPCHGQADDDGVIPRQHQIDEQYLHEDEQ